MVKRILVVSFSVLVGFCSIFILNFHTEDNHSIPVLQANACVQV